MKKYLKYMILAVLALCVYKAIDKVLDKMYLGQYTINDYTDDTRFTTVNKVLDKRFEKSDVAILINTEYIDQVVSTAPYAYSKKIPVFYTEKQKVLKPVYDEMEKLGVKKVILVGGVNSLSESVERSLERNGYKFERINESRGINFSIKIAEMMMRDNKISEIAVVTSDEFDLPNAISFSPYSQKNKIPILVTSNTQNDYLKIKKLIRNNNINKVYLIGNEGYLNSNFDRLANVKIQKIKGEDRYDFNKKLIKTIYGKSDNGNVYISKGGELLHKRHIGSGQLINAIAISPLAADNDSPLLFIENNYFETQESQIVEKNGYKILNQVGFKIERRNYFNIERMKNATTVVLILISIMMVVRVSRNSRDEENKKIL